MYYSDPGTIRRRRRVLPARLIGDASPCLTIEIQVIKMDTVRRAFVGREIEPITTGRKRDTLNFPRSGGELSLVRAVAIGQIQMRVAVPLAGKVDAAIGQPTGARAPEIAG